MAEENSIKVTNGEAITLLGNSVWSNRALPVKARYWLSRIADRVQGIVKAYNKERDQIIKDFCIKDTEGNPVPSDKNKYTFDPGQETLCNKAIGELTIIENELPWPRLTIDLAESPDGFGLSAAEMADAITIAEFTFSEVKTDQAKKAA